MFNSYFRKLKSFIIIIIYIIQQGKKIKAQNLEIKSLSPVFNMTLRTSRDTVRETSIAGTPWEKLGNKKYQKNVTLLLKHLLCQLSLFKNH